MNTSTRTTNETESGDRDVDRTIEVHATARRLLGDLVVRGARVELPEPKLLAWRAELDKTPEAIRRKLAVHVLATAVKLARTQPEESKTAVAQLTELAASLLGSSAAMRDVVERVAASKPAVAGVEPQAPRRAAQFGAAMPAGTIRASALIRPLPRPIAPSIPVRPRAEARRAF